MLDHFSVLPVAVRSYHQQRQYRKASPRNVSPMWLDVDKDVLQRTRLASYNAKKLFSGFEIQVKRTLDDSCVISQERHRKTVITYVMKQLGRRRHNLLAAEQLFVRSSSFI